MDITKIIYIIMGLGIFASPMFVVDRINSLDNIYVRKETAETIKSDVNSIKEQQKTDHDIIIRIAEKLGVHNGRSN